MYKKKEGKKKQREKADRLSAAFNSARLIKPREGKPCRRLEKDTHPSDYFAPFIHADVVLAFFPLYSDVAPKRFRLDDEKSCKQGREAEGRQQGGGRQTNVVTMCPKIGLCAVHRKTPSLAPLRSTCSLERCQFLPR